MKHVRIFLIVITFAGMNSCTETPVRYSSEAIRTPTLFAKGIVSTEQHNEFNIEFSPDGKTAYFTRRQKDEPQNIYISHYENNTWTTPEIASFSTERDEMPSITPDGKQLYFSSTRPIPNRKTQGNFDMNVWVTTSENNSWKTAQPLDSIINNVQKEGEQWPSSNEGGFYTQDGKTFYFATMLPYTKGIGLYTTTLQNNRFSTPKRVEGLFDNDSIWTSSPTLSPDGNYLLFNAYGAKNGFGGEDIYVSKKTNNGWSKAVNLGKLINSPNEEASPRFSPDGHYFFFSSNVGSSSDADGIWSIYYLETQYLSLERLFN